MGSPIVQPDARRTLAPVAVQAPAMPVAGPIVRDVILFEAGSSVVHQDGGGLGNVTLGKLVLGGVVGDLLFVV